MANPLFTLPTLNDMEKADWQQQEVITMLEYAAAVPLCSPYILRH